MPKVLKPRTKCNRNRDRYYDFCFTWNNYTEEVIERLIKDWPKTDKTKYIFSTEIGAEEGTPHLQGYVKFQFQKSLDALRKKYHGMSVDNRKAKDDRKATNYCQKIATSTGRVFAQGIKIERQPIDYVAMHGTRPWQQAILDEIKLPANDRTIRWIFDAKGMGGKSALCRHLMLQGDVCFILGGDPGSLVRGITNHVLGNKKLEKDPQELKVVIVDIPRPLGNGSKGMYCVLESLKSGVLCSTKYDSDSLVLPIFPHVFVFCNERPKAGVYTCDRIVLTDLGDHTWGVPPQTPLTVVAHAPSSILIESDEGLCDFVMNL